MSTERRGTEPRSTATVEEQLRAALEAAESREARYHIRESMQLLHLESESET